MIDTLEKLRAELEQRRGDWPAIAKRAQISYSQLARIVVGKRRAYGSQNPGVKTVLALMRELNTPQRASTRMRIRRSR